jgi:IPT/TIG domain
VGTSVTVSGTNFGSTQGTSTVTFNGTAATPTSWSATSITVPVPAAATTGNIVVTVSGLQSNAVSFVVSPSITGVSPSSGAVGTSVAIGGNNFGSTQGTSTVTFNGTTASPSSWSATSITASVPSTATTGNIVVTVSGLQSNALSFVVPPSITGLSPNIGGVGTPVTINGYTFGSTQGSSTVTFNGSSTGPSSWSSTAITAPVPSGATPGNVLVTVNGMASNGVNFTVTQGNGNVYCTTSGTWIGATTDGPASLPTVCYYTAVSGTPSPGTVRGPVSTVSAFNSAYSAAACGDVIEITAGSSLTGPVTLNGKGCDDQHYITIESTGISNTSFPVEGTRTTPCWSNLPSLPNRPAYPCSSPQTLTAQFVATSSNNAVVLNGADHIRFIGIEFTRVSTAGALIYSLASLNANGATQSNHIVFDRVWLHGINQDGHFPQTSGTDTSTTRGIWLGQSNYVALIDSYCSDFYDNGSTSSNGNTDAQCVGGGVGGTTNSGWGVYKFVNNHMEGASETILLGGGGGPALAPSGCTQFVNCNLDVPQNIEVRNNYLFKSPGWNGNGVATGWPNVKNGIEFKTGANILMEGNISENCWYNSQPACYAWDLAPKNQSNAPHTPIVGTCLTCQVQNVVVRYNYAYGYPYGAAVYSTMDAGCSNCTTRGDSYSIHDNVWGDNFKFVSGSGGDGLEFLADAGPMTNISFRHNTSLAASRAMIIFAGSTSGQIDHFTFQDNLFAEGTYGVQAASNAGQGCDYGGTGGPQFDSTNTFLGILNYCVNGTTNTWTADHNVVWGSNAITNWPTGNTKVAAIGNVGFTTVPSNNSLGYPDSAFNLTDWALSSSSSFHNAASDGKDVGADIPTLLTKIAGVRQ